MCKTRVWLLSLEVVHQISPIFYPARVYEHKLTTINIEELKAFPFYTLLIWDDLKAERIDPNVWVCLLKF